MSDLKEHFENEFEYDEYYVKWLERLCEEQLDILEEIHNQLNDVNNCYAQIDADIIEPIQSILKRLNKYQDNGD